jgi:hypothetical protein
MQRSERDLTTDLALGAVAGVLATYVMGQVTTTLYEREERSARAREEAVRGGKPAYERAVEGIARSAGVRLGRRQRERLGSAAHWALGIGMGAAYGALRGRVPWLSRGAGTLFGALFFLAFDEAANVALGITPGPEAFPWQTHARGLAGHVVYGAVADGTLRALEAAR